MNIIQAESRDWLDEARTLFQEYEQELGADLCFQKFSEELASLPGKYQPPDGALLLALSGSNCSGCVALRRLSSTTCEMKRLYVRPDYRGTGLGRILAEKIISCARLAGYQVMYLDTLERLGPALNLYRSLGFRETEPYYHNPLKGVVYLQLDLNT